MKHLVLAATAALAAVSAPIDAQTQPVIPVAAEVSPRPSLAPLLKRLRPERKRSLPSISTAILRRWMH